MSDMYSNPHPCVYTALAAAGLLGSTGGQQQLTVSHEVPAPLRHTLAHTCWLARLCGLPGPARPGPACSDWLAQWYGVPVRTQARCCWMG